MQQFIEGSKRQFPGVPRDVEELKKQKGSATIEQRVGDNHGEIHSPHHQRPYDNVPPYGHYDMPWYQGKQPTRGGRIGGLGRRGYHRPQEEIMEKIPILVKQTVVAIMVNNKGIRPWTKSSGRGCTNKLMTLTWGNKSVEEYRQEMELYTLRLSLEEDKDAFIYRFLSGFNRDMTNQLELYLILLMKTCVIWQPRLKIKGRVWCLNLKHLPTRVGQRKIKRLSLKNIEVREEVCTRMQVKVFKNLKTRKKLHLPSYTANSDEANIDGTVVAELAEYDPNDISIKYNELKGLTNCDENNAKTCTGHLQAAPVLQQASLPNKLANTYGVKSLSHVPGT
ncbi:hypothetical protein M9H77_31170 [Catharanthus roseus]|uniref:Uncharacterized protein n=1 Tax=Catharanthus roseus TaxID=4058 RepID=A0ACB9ZZA3_CATRO|nr:hypothetical protein M9H77_31170 [Catharanthus roseus]